MHELRRDSARGCPRPRERLPCVRRGDVSSQHPHAKPTQASAQERVLELEHERKPVHDVHMRARALDELPVGLQRGGVAQPVVDDHARPGRAGRRPRLDLE